MKIKGTIKELSGRVQSGDMILGQPELSVLTRVLEAAGQARRLEKAVSPYKGRDPVVWEIDCPFLASRLESKE